MVAKEGPDMSHNHHTFQGRRNKLSVWVKKIINTTTTTNAPVSSSQKPRRADVGPRRAKRTQLDSKETTISSSLRPIVGRNSWQSSGSDDEGGQRIVWDEPPAGKFNQQQQQQQQQHDNASVIPLVSFCSSSVKSSTFSDIHSIQSTRPTIFSGRTLETNSSVLAIPPQSILDRSRPLPPSNASNTTTRRP